MKHILEYIDYSHYEDELDDLESFRPTKPKRRAKKRDIKPQHKPKHNRVSEYTSNDLIKEYINYAKWVIVWNHTKDHDMLKRIVNRTEYDVPYMNDKIKVIIDYIESKWSHFNRGDYMFTLKDSKIKIALNLNKNQHRIYIGTILGYDMGNFSDVLDAVILNESNQEVNIIKEITLFI